jgi:hypothetical protein
MATCNCENIEFLSLAAVTGDNLENVSSSLVQIYLCRIDASRLIKFLANDNVISSVNLVGIKGLLQPCALLIPESLWRTNSKISILIAHLRNSPKIFIRITAVTGSSYLQ